MQKLSTKGAGLAAWLISVCGWLLCAGMCLTLTIALEVYPYAYEVFFPAILLILFCNILVFLFIVSRWGPALSRLWRAVARVCVGEAIILAGMYGLGRFCM
ncbi:MAG: hypothetical protein HDQ44_01895 [Desulfovibrio sp.]|nr:hypothetical protein [Desulfovibrio sp.]